MIRFLQYPAILMCNGMASLGARHACAGSLWLQGPIMACFLCHALSMSCQELLGEQSEPGPPCGSGLGTALPYAADPGFFLLGFGVDEDNLGANLGMGNLKTEPLGHSAYLTADSRLNPARSPKPSGPAAQRQFHLQSSRRQQNQSQKQCLNAPGWREPGAFHDGPGPKASFLPCPCPGLEFGDKTKRFDIDFCCSSGSYKNQNQALVNLHS